jgi:hypothetical protein
MVHRGAGDLLYGGRMSNLRIAVIAIATAALGCGPETATAIDGSTGDDASGSDADVVACDAPDVLVVLDRTQSMYRRPDGSPPATHAESRWYIAVNAIEAVSAQFQATIRFGLELFPRDPLTDTCVTLAERIAGTEATNPICEAGEVLVQPAISTATAIDGVIDPETTSLCYSTPIGAALGTARDALAAIKQPMREQYVMFVSDGADSCDDALALTNTQLLAADGVKTFVIAFDSSGDEIDRGLLNDMACAGRTAPAFPAGCAVDGAGNYVATDRLGATQFLDAGDAAGLAQAFTDIAGKVCCGCVL